MQSMEGGYPNAEHWERDRYISFGFSQPLLRRLKFSPKYLPSVALQLMAHPALCVPCGTLHFKTVNCRYVRGAQERVPRRSIGTEITNVLSCSCIPGVRWMGHRVVVLVTSCDSRLIIGEYIFSHSAWRLK